MIGEHIRMTAHQFLLTSGHTKATRLFLEIQEAVGAYDIKRAFDNDR